MSATIDVAVLIGSRNDRDTIKAATDVLRQFGVTHEARVLSAHRTPEETAQYVRQAEAAGTKIFIAAAGMAAHLAGMVAANTTRPVIGVPLASSELNGLDALLATAQMPPGVPVATQAIGRAGAVNAALLAVSILALERPELHAALEEHRRKNAQQILTERLE